MPYHTLKNLKLKGEHDDYHIIGLILDTSSIGRLHCSVVSSISFSALAVRATACHHG